MYFQASVVNNPKYTFLLPAYKARYLRQALQSILAQTFPSFCILVSDDASPEPIKEIVDSLNDDRIVYSRNEKNLGARNLVVHWNKILDKCTSEYVIVASDDDLYNPDFLLRMDELVHHYPDVDLLRAAAEIIDGEGKPVKSEIPGEAFLQMDGMIRHLLDPTSVLCVGNYIFRTSALKQSGGFVDLPLGWKSDSATVIALSANGVPCSGEVLFSFRMSDINISSQSGPNPEREKEKLRALLAFYDWLEGAVPPEIFSSFSSAVKNRLQGEARSYYSALSWREFRLLYKRFVREKWFPTLRNRLSFIWGRV